MHFTTSNLPRHAARKKALGLIFSQAAHWAAFFADFFSEKSSLHFSNSFALSIFSFFCII